MRKLLLFISILQLFKANAQTAQFSWLSGSTFTNQISVVGTKGVPSNTNVIGARQDAQYWNDSQNNLYIFGGSGVNSAGNITTRNDLWRFDLTTNEYVWLTGSNALGSSGGVYGTKGVASTTNTPGSRYGGATWVDNNGDLWMFGGDGSAASSSGLLQDLWKYSPANNTWMWVSGSNAAGQWGTYAFTPSLSNVPGSRHSAVTWVDNAGNLWLFGGYGLTTNLTLGYLSDLWKFDVTTSMWSWISGNSVPNSLGTYGTKGTASTFNKPSGRQGSVSWIDNTGNLWLFGGFGKSSITTNGNLNDLWKFDMVSSQWTWMTGSNSPGAVNTSSIQGSPSATYTPGSRMNAVSWKDGNYFWLFGGAPYASSVQTPYNDLWVYSVANNTWAWVAGTFTINQVGVYGTQNVLSQNNIIGSRQHACSFKDINGDLILFGGLGHSSVNAGHLNDFWKIKPCYTNFAVNTTAALNQAICPNKTTTLSASGSGILGWYTAASGGTYLGSGTTLSTPTLTSNTTYYVQDSTCGAGPRTAITVTINNVPTVVITGTNLACANRTVALNTGGSASTYTWSTSQTITSIIVTPSVTTTYTVIGTAANSCTNSAVKTITVNPLPTLTVTGNNTICAGNPTTLTASGANTYTWSAGFISPVISVAPISSTTYSVIGKDANNCTNTTTYFVTVNPLPTINISTTNTLLCSGETSTLSVLGANSYTWSNSSNGTDIIVTPSITTNYSVTGVDANGCSNNSVFTQSVSVCTGIQEAKANLNSALAFPNPNNGEFTIQSQMADVVSLTNELGQLIEMIELNQQNNFSYKVSQLSNGIYFLVGKTVKQKVIVTK